MGGTWRGGYYPTCYEKELYDVGIGNPLRHCARGPRGVSAEEKL